MEIGTSYNFWALVYFQSACIFSKCFIIFLSVSQRLFIFSNCESALFIFFFQKHYSALALISGCEAHNFLIMLLIIFDILNMFNISINYVQNF